MHVSGNEGISDTSSVKMLSQKITRYFVLTLFSAKTKTKMAARAFLNFVKQFSALF